MANLNGVMTELQIGIVERVNALKTLDALMALPGTIYDVEATLAAAREERDAYEREWVREAREMLENTTLAASMEAPADGKNAEQRKMQLDLFLARDTRVQAVKRRLRECEDKLAEHDGQVALVEIELRETQNRLRATLAASALQAEIIRAYTR